MSLAGQTRSTLPPPPKPVAARMSPTAAYAAVVERLEATRSRILRNTVAALVMTVMTVALAAFALCAVVDYSLTSGLSFSGRLLGLLTIVGVCIQALISGWRAWVAPYSLQRAAEDVEEHVSEFGQGLRTAIDYHEAAARDFAVRPASASPGLIGALQQETYAVSETAPWDEIAPARWMLRALLALLLASGLWLIALAITPELRIAAGRMLLLPLQYTQVTFDPQQATIKHGESVLIKAEITGRPLKDAPLRYQVASKPGEWTTVELLPPVESEVEGDVAPLQLHGTVQTKLTKLLEDVDFEVLAGPVKLPAGHIRVLLPVTIKKYEAHISPPAYTKKPATVVEKYDLKVWEGSAVDFAIELNRPVALASLTFQEKDQPATEIPATIEGSNLKLALRDLRKSGTYTLSAVAADEMALTPQKIKIQVTLDRPPTVQWVQPEENWDATPTTEVTMSIAAGDDLGIHKAGIAYQIGTGPLVKLWETNAEGAEQSLAAVAALLLEEVQVDGQPLTHQQSVTYHAFAEDNYFDKPRRATTPLRFIDIRPYQRDFQLMEGGGSCNGESVTLEELIKRQREQLNQSFAAQSQTKIPAALAQQLSQAQSELMNATIEFKDGLAEMGGKIEPLEKAAWQMGAAMTALEPGDLETAIPAQQQALADLITARENLRKRLSQSQSAAACKKFDREQKQKLRLPEQKKQEQQQQLAQSRKQLEELAKKERQWSQQASQACQNPSSSSSSTGQSKPSESKPGESEPQPSKEDVAKAQEQLQKELAEIQEQLAQNDLAGKTAQEQANRAAESMQKGKEAVEKSQGDEANKQGESAADKLEQLAAHLAAMGQKDVGQRLNQAQREAARLAAEQEQLAKEVGGKPGQEGGGREGEAPAEPKPGQGSEKSNNQLAGEQQDLAQQMKMLAEVLEKLRGDAQKDKGPAGGLLEKVAAEQKPGEIAGGMEKAADDLKKGDKPGAQTGAEAARDELAELAQALGAAKGKLSQPQLQELIKLEEQLAQLREKAEGEGKKPGEGEKTGDKEGQKPGEGQRPGEGKQGEGEKPGEGQKPGEGKSGQAPGASEKWDEVQEKLQELAEADKRLEAALRKLGGNQQPKPGDKLRPSEFQQNSNQETPPGHYSWDQLGDYKGLDEIAKVLQTKIQEAILAGALQDSDEPVPTEYKGLVEKYYRTLSDDLR